MDEYSIRPLILRDVKNFVKDFDERIEKIFKDDKLYEELRVSSKYSVSKGVYGVPFLFVNDVEIDDESFDRIEEIVNDFLKSFESFKLSFK